MMRAVFVILFFCNVCEFLYCAQKNFFRLPNLLWHIQCRQVSFFRSHLRLNLQRVCPQVKGLKNDHRCFMLSKTTNIFVWRHLGSSFHARINETLAHVWECVFDLHTSSSRQETRNAGRYIERNAVFTKLVQLFTNGAVDTRVAVAELLLPFFSAFRITPITSSKQIFLRYCRFHQALRIL